MARTSLSENLKNVSNAEWPTDVKRVQEVASTGDELMDLAVDFAEAKINEDRYKKQASELNTKMKEAMGNEGTKEIKLANGTIKLIDVEKTVVDTEFLLKTVKELGLVDLIKVTESVDVDKLESLLYNNELPQEQVAVMTSAFSTQMSTQLRFTKAKGVK